MVRKKKINGVSNIMKKYEIKGMYEGVFKAVEHAIGFNLYSDYASLGDVVILNDNDEIARLDYEDYDYFEMIREIKKQLIKNGLYVTEMEAEPNTLVLKTTNNLLSLLYVSDNDSLDDNYEADELAEIKTEIEQEQRDIEEAEATTWNELYERELEEHKAEHTMVCPKCGKVAKNEAPNGAGVLEECNWYCDICGWVMEDEEDIKPTVS